MTNLKELLKVRLNDARRIAVLGVGSELRGDDACGVLVAEAIEKSRAANKSGRRIKAFIGCTAPENLTGEIKKFKPTHVVIVDAADIAKKPGTVKLIDHDKISGTSFCTHQLPLKILADYLMQSTGCKVLVIGIQPKDMAFDSRLSKEVKKAVSEVSGAIKSLA